MTERLIRDGDEPGRQAARIAVARARGLSPTETEEVRVWLDRSPEYALELALVEDLGGSAELVAALNEVRGASAAAERHPISAFIAAVRGRLEAIGARTVLATSAASLAGVLLMVAIAPGSKMDRAAPGAISAAITFETARGQTREDVLDDGSVIALSADTMLAWLPSTTERSVVLGRGEAFFQVATDPGRQFRVTVGDTVFEALGTRFNVDRREHGVELTVYEGVVRASRDDWSQVLRAGDVAVIGSDGAVARRQVDPVEGPDWLNGWLEARAAPLAEVAEELQRYTTKHVIIAENVSGRQIDGRFPLAEPRDALERIARVQGLSFSETDGAFVITGGRR